GREVPQPAVDQLAAPATGAVRQVVALHQGHVHAATGGVECDPDARDSGTDDQHLRVPAVSEFLQFGAAAFGVQQAAGFGGADHERYPFTSSRSSDSLPPMRWAKTNVWATRTRVSDNWSGLPARMLPSPLPAWPCTIRSRRTVRAIRWVPPSRPVIHSVSSSGS